MESIVGGGETEARGEEEGGERDKVVSRVRRVGNRKRGRVLLRVKGSFKRSRRFIIQIINSLEKKNTITMMTIEIRLQSTILSPYASSPTQLSL